MPLVTFVRNALRRYFVLGLIVFIPLIVTVKFLFAIIHFFDDILAVDRGRFLYVVPEHYHPHQWIGYSFPGLGVLFSVLCILALGALSRNYFGKKMLRWGDAVVDRIPLARSIYKVVKDMVNVYATHRDHQFSRVVLVDFPAKGVKSLGFVTGPAYAKVEALTGQSMVSVFMPTTPNPTSGFLMFIPAVDVIDLDMTVEDAFKIIVSGGMVLPHAEEKSQP